MRVGFLCSVFLRRVRHLRHRWSAMAVCECEHSWHVFPYTLLILLVPHNYQSPWWCLDTVGAAGRGLEICLPYNRRHQDRRLADVPIKHLYRKAFQSHVTLGVFVWCLLCGLAASQSLLRLHSRERNIDMRLCERWSS